MSDGPWHMVFAEHVSWYMEKNTVLFFPDEVPFSVGLA
jgi:hypothetical protein